MLSPEESVDIDKMRAERDEKLKAEHAAREGMRLVEKERRPGTASGRLDLLGLTGEEVRKVPTQFGEQTQDRVSPAEEASDRFDVHGSFSAKAIWHMNRAKTLMNGTTSVVYPFVRAHLAAALELLR
jgi:hypothetical protein